MWGSVLMVTEQGTESQGERETMARGKRANNAGQWRRCEQSAQLEQQSDGRTQASTKSDAHVPAVGSVA